MAAREEMGGNRPDPPPEPPKHTSEKTSQAPCLVLRTARRMRRSCPAAVSPGSRSRSETRPCVRSYMHSLPSLHEHTSEGEGRGGKS